MSFDKGAKLSLSKSVSIWLLFATFLMVDTFFMSYFINQHTASFSLKGGSLDGFFVIGLIGSTTFVKLSFVLCVILNVIMAKCMDHLILFLAIAFLKVFLLSLTLVW